MNIIKSNKELSVKEIYFLTMNPQTQKMKDVVGQRIEISNWVIYEDINKKSGEVQEILTIATHEGETFATNSPTFKDDFIAMWELFTGMDATVPAIIVTNGMSKNNREYISCIYSD